ncbi:MAG: hypothetical protein Q9163_003623 [Psora crenata]
MVPVPGVVWSNIASAASSLLSPFTVGWSALSVGVFSTRLILLYPALTLRILNSHDTSPCENTSGRKSSTTFETTSIIRCGPLFFNYRHLCPQVAVGSRPPTIIAPTSVATVASERYSCDYLQQSRTPDPLAIPLFKTFNGDRFAVWVDHKGFIVGRVVVRTMKVAKDIHSLALPPADIQKGLCHRSWYLATATIPPPATPIAYIVTAINNDVHNALKLLVDPEDRPVALIKRKLG